MSSKFLNANTDVNLSADSDSQIPSQKAVKTYVDNKTSVLATKEEVTTITNQIGDQVSVIASKIPEAASDTNQLADKQFVQDLTSAINFVQWVDTLPETGESKYIYAVPREETDTDGKPIAALYLWDGTRWNGAGAFSLNIDPATLATKTDLTNYLPLTGGTLSGSLYFPNEKSRIVFRNITFAREETSLILTNSGKRFAFLADGNFHSTSAGRILGTNDKSVANGVASLDANAKVPENQLPDSVANQAILREW